MILGEVSCWALDCPSCGADIGAHLVDYMFHDVETVYQELERITDRVLE